ncbi:uncharacterized protein LOC111079455 [Drosophila obscura]|uniref:uncharacterized protein LOC111079455 n=1 Tax=Drosophila obscura TaxID=7282 RepID=UPI001BB11DFF|nr:uncharacterized protein LOC111079455 [Drosophila obscura]XP_041449843.1 uncharacterized protein LOC111079455 [Drosophila obscura]XP_041449844.1 uncharacterized protein LOC111079455 [Drosophila obscura]XP_041449845.1 uncharacterized protein LOC111079455 [Drosophila obscura]XP_041449846.1 uncharacterized protein LOC111079455 [Drosophila obscura]
MEKTCRFCKGTSGAFINIFDETQKWDTCIADMISECTGYVVRRGDSLPENICPPCLEDAVSASTPGKPGPKKTVKTETKSVHRPQSEIASWRAPTSKSGQSMTRGTGGKPVIEEASNQSEIAAGKRFVTGGPPSTSAGGDAATATQGKKPSYQDRRRAAFILSNDDPEFRSSAKGIEQRLWASSIIPDFQPAKAGKGTAKAPNKRQRSAEDPAAQPCQGKRAKAHSANRSFAKVAMGKTLIGVLDRGAKDGNVPRDKWHLVDAELQDKFLEELVENGGPPPKCEDAGWHQGTVKAIACQDARSAGLYIKAVAALKEVYPGAKLEAVKWEDIPRIPRARAWVSVKPAEPEKILKVLQVCNPHLPTTD